ncbi:MAG: helicase-exonuclease AddAB subunit AddA [Lachnospiraceae bacterium]|nr:helicase-exonuclease AddAB subunit AddA [Lachnospiraceae bacterium]
MGWTKEQKRVIDARGRNLLVSAAAGSGKTAVMVERIIALVSDEAHPVDIDHLLVVTFTNAAASEMKERIMNALEKKVQDDPGNQHLLRQIARVHKAQITTIHSFCLNLIREHFMEVDLDPGFRIGEEGEIGLLHQDALEEVLEEAYEEKNEAFLDFVESYASGKTDKKIEEMILHAYTFARSGAKPQIWLKEAEQVFYADEEVLLKQDWVTYLLKEISADVQEIEANYDRILEMAQDTGIPDGHRKAVEEEYDRIESFRKAETLNDFIEAASGWKKTAIRGRAGKQHDKEKVKQMMGLRKATQDMIDRFIERKLPQDEKSIVRDMKQCRKTMSAFVNCVLRFMEIVQKKKKEKNLVDFSDLEQYALQILTEGYDEDGNPIPSKTALEKKKYYAEIYVDEYQDTNEIQEAVIRLISGDSIGKHTLFTVGDVKQSIYGFRQAKPELFISRYYDYRGESKEHELIELQNNFRSRKEVLHTANYLFYRLMKRELGGIEYDKSASLVPTMGFPTDHMDAAAELHLLHLDDGVTAMSDVEAEAVMIGQRIREMIDGDTPQLVTCIQEDGTKGLRKAEYRDIVILLRTVSGWGETIQEQLDRMGIPAFCESAKGSFSTIEVQTLMSILKVLDNERQDIPFAAFLRAPFIGLSGEEMVWMSSLKELEQGQTCSMADHMRNYLEHGDRTEIIQKLQKADAFLREFRCKKQYLSIPDLIRDILDSTGYYHMIGAMPAGERRQANVRMLIQKAKQFENGSYKGLFYFVRYMEQLKEYDIDYGEANVQGEHENLVRIMSIHKSKGLEYPIVILAGMSKKFNMMDSRNAVLMHSDYHFGPDAVLLETREKHPTLLKKMIALKIQEEIISEEMRILYVAMTRAKDKLLMTGAVKKLSDQLDKNHRRRKKNPGYFDIKTAGSYMDWILMAFAYHPAMKPVYESYFPADNTVYDEEGVSDLKVRVTSPSDLEEIELDSRDAAEQQKAKLFHEIVHYEEIEVLQALKTELDQKYRYQSECDRRMKYSVSEIKHRSQQELDEETAFASVGIKESDPLVPDFLKKEKQISPTGRGTAVHKCMELLDFTKDYTEESLKETLQLWIAQGKIDEDCEKVISLKEILWFLHSRVGKRVKNAAKEGHVCKETQFIIGIPLKELEEGTDSMELAVVQGIIDLYFVENDEIVLVDYKTDRVRRGEEEILIGHYQAQMRSYQRALEQTTGKKVKEIYLASLTLRKNIIL